MSKTRHDVFVCPPLPHPVTTLTHELPDRHEIPRHLHPEHQLIYASRGVMSVWTGNGTWIVPPQRELILHACTFPTLRKHVKAQAHVIDMILDQLKVLEMAPLRLADPTDARAVRVAEALAKDLGSHRSLDAVCRHAGASRRTIERLFQAETNMSLGRWRQQLRLACSLRLLAKGESITRVALETGYSTPSALVAMFRKALGTTPRRDFAT